MCKLCQNWSTAGRKLQVPLHFLTSRPLLLLSLAGKQPDTRESVFALHTYRLLARGPQRNLYRLAAYRREGGGGAHRATCLLHTEQLIFSRRGIPQRAMTIDDTPEGPPRRTRAGTMVSTRFPSFLKRRAQKTTLLSPIYVS